MKTKPYTAAPALHLRQRMTAGAAVLLLSACGGGAGSGEQAVSAASAPPLQSNAVLTVVLDTPPLDQAGASIVARPLYDLAPALLDEPDERDAADAGASAHRAPRTQRLTSEERRMATRGLTVQTIRQGRQTRALGADQAAAPLATPAVIATYTPAQIRAAYGLPPLPAAGAVLSSAQRAQLGAGQTIYIVNAMHDPNVATELAAFNQKFGLPGCVPKPIAATLALPLAGAASTSGCELSVVYSTAAGAMSASAPAYESGWATEIALDVQWAHATAPLARIILIEAPDASLNQLVGAIRLANAMGPGVVSMSFGAVEGSWTGSVESAFGAPGMSYLAATGDSGASVSWPSVSPRVLAVGGTTLSYSGSGARSESAWSGTGGGISAYTATPAYQNGTVPGMGLPLRRTVADVAFNANPASGQFVAVIASGSSTVNWVSAGGTSLSTPQWAGLMAVANAQRALNGKAVLGAPHAALYAQVAAVPAYYASAFADITGGSNGSCGTCMARSGYDALAGLGTPNAASLLQVLSGAVIAPAAPLVTSAAITAKAGSALAFTVSASGPNPLSYALSGAPSGMLIGATGVVSWPTPLIGTYAVKVLASDSKTGLSGQGIYTVTISAPPAPVVAAAAISGKVGSALAFTAVASADNPLTFSFANMPAGMTGSSSGSVNWPVPLAGTFTVTVTAKDSKTGASGQGVYTIAIAAPLAPLVSAASISGKPGVALSFAPTVVASNPLTYSLAGAPAGMTVSTSGTLNWPSPVLGSYSVTLSARDGKTGLSGQANIAIKIATAGPSISAAAMTGVAGKPLSGTIAISAPGATALSVSLTGVPLGMGFTFNGTVLGAQWASPVAGSYTLVVVATDSAGLSARASVPVTISAK